MRAAALYFLPSEQVCTLANRQLLLRVSRGKVLLFCAALISSRHLERAQVSSLWRELKLLKAGNENNIWLKSPIGARTFTEGRKRLLERKWRPVCSVSVTWRNNELWDVTPARSGARLHRYTAGIEHYLIWEPLHCFFFRPDWGKYAENRSGFMTSLTNKPCYPTLSPSLRFLGSKTQE